jgi:hypothetical protein
MYNGIKSDTTSASAAEMQSIDRFGPSYFLSIAKEPQ